MTLASDPTGPCRALRGRPSDSLAGAEADVEAAKVLRAVSQIRKGRVFSLDSGWWHGMPHGPAHAPFQLLTYRSPLGERIEADIPWLVGKGNVHSYGFVSELLIASMHTGTHIDALCHVTAGPDDTWYGGGSAGALLGDFGAHEMDAAALPPIFTRGVLLDIPSLHGWAACPANYPISEDDIAGCCEASAVEVLEGDAILVRTGLMQFWPRTSEIEARRGAGLSLAAAEFIADKGAMIVGADTGVVEVQPSEIADHPQPVHDLLIRQRGIPLIEWLYLEDLAAANECTFVFVCLPLRVRGATGSLVRPVAIT